MCVYACMFNPNVRLEISRLLSYLIISCHLAVASPPTRLPVKSLHRTLLSPPMYISNTRSFGRPFPTMSSTFRPPDLLSYTVPYISCLAFPSVSHC